MLPTVEAQGGQEPAQPEDRSEQESETVSTAQIVQEEEKKNHNRVLL
jgi:hypothetical protein